MHNILKGKIDRWNTASYREKSGITWEVVHAILNGGGRFLQQDPCYGWFVPVEDEVARRKVSIAFRDMAKRIRKRSQRRGADHSQEKSFPVHSVASHQMSARNQEQYLFSSKKTCCPAPDSQASDGAVCSFLCDHKKSGTGASSRKASSAFESWG
jgi:hypothetical protein